MKITVLVPSEEYKGFAGARIRYGRIAEPLAGHGVSLELQDIGTFQLREDQSDIVIISKCHDARSLVIAALLARSGRLVGVDLFDDYFSQSADSRLNRFRAWLAQLLDHCQFALCSTRAMADVARAYRGDIAVHVTHDPAPAVDARALERRLATKLARARDRQSIQVAWFGVGDNPHFPVGLHDVAGFAESLGALNRTGLAVELNVLTNARALTADGLAQLASLPVETRVGEWSEAAEQALLADALVAYLPVNLKAFSTAKSLNRAVTALSAGCQVLSAGFPLYSALDELIYRDPAALAADIGSGALRHSPDRIDRFAALMDSFASAATEAKRLSQFLQSLSPAPASDTPIAIVHGHSTNARAGEMVRAAGGLTIASPYASASLATDVLFRWNVDRLHMLISEAAAHRLRPGLRRRLSPVGNVNGRPFLELRDRAAPARAPNVAQPADRPLAAQLATYRFAIDEIGQRMNEAFGACTLILSENSTLPFAAEV